MRFFQTAPFLRLLFPFIMGIICCLNFGSNYSIENIVILLLFVILSTFTFIRSYKYEWIYGIILTVFFFAIGFYAAQTGNEKNHDTHYSKYIGQQNTFLIQINDEPVEKEKSIKVEAKIIAVRSNNRIIPCTGKVIFYFRKDSASPTINYGDEIILSASLKEIAPPKNPGEFDYKKYLGFHNVYHQAFVRSGQWKYTGVNDGNFIIKDALHLRQKLLNVLTENKIEGDEYAVGAALLMGFESKLNQDIIAAYASSGALHVLSVSGLHVAIIYILFNWLLVFLEKYKYGKAIKAIALLLILWFYATLTGLSPSVLRSTAMFSFVVVGRSFKKQTNIYNTLAVSAFILLLIDPLLIMDVGFQLSYLAVLGIVVINPGLNALYNGGNWLIEKIWSLISVSLSAQLATFPLGLLYFHQFPNYFIFSNLVVIPLSSIVLYLGILLFFISWIPWIGSTTGILLKWTLIVLNGSVKLVEGLPYALWNGVSINIVETWILYFFIIFILLFFIKKSAIYLQISLGFIIMILSAQLFEKKMNSKQLKFIVYNIPHTSAYDFITGTTNCFMADSSLINDDKKLLFHVKHNWWNLGVEEHLLKPCNAIELKSGELCRKNQFIQFDNKKIFVLDRSFNNYNLSGSEKIKIDYIIISGNPYIDVDKISSTFTFTKIIIDSSNNMDKVKFMEREFKKYHISYYSVMRSGAYMEDVKI